MRVPLPEVPATRVSGEIEGDYLLGEGRYRARWVMLDDRQRVCRKQWSIQVKPSFSERHMKLAMEHNAVSEFSWESILGPGLVAADAPPRDLTILLDVASIAPRRGQGTFQWARQGPPQLGESDRLLLIALASSVLESVPARRVRLVAFNLDQQKEIFRREWMTPGDLAELRQALDAVQPGAVDYHLLRNPRGYRDLLAGLVNRELSDDSSSADVLFLGPVAPYVDNMPVGKLEFPALEERDGAMPRFYYFQYRPFLTRPVSYFPDIIDSLVARLKGKRFVIHTPVDFERAIRRLER
jgi:hypothetical protein